MLLLKPRIKRGIREVGIYSPTGLFILTIEIWLTVALINNNFKGNNIKYIPLNIFMDDYKLFVNKQTVEK